MSVRVAAALAALAAAAAAGAASEDQRAPSPAELRAAVEGAYRALPGYRDEGEIERAETRDGETTVRRWRFETAAAGGALRLLLRDTAGDERVLWGDAGGGWQPPTAPPAVESGDAAPRGGFGESIEVALRTLVVRALDRSGDPIPGLAAPDFVVFGGRGGERRELPVVAAEWVAAGGVAAGEPGGGAGERTWPGGDEAAGGAGPAGRLVLLFVQTDPQAIRLRGQFKQLPFARELIDALPAGDRLAVVSFDSHLKLWQDFTGDPEAVYEALERAVHFGGRPAGRRPDGPGLGERWDPRAAMAVATAERGLEMTAEALVALPGEKAVVWLGWGLGRLDRGVVRRRPGHAEAVAALLAARASVFVLDVTDAAYHDLEMGLRAIAEETGGTYAKTHTFAGQVTRRLARTLAGHYELSIDVSAAPGGPGELPGESPGALPGEITVELRGRPGRVLVRPPAD